MLIPSSLEPSKILTASPQQQRTLEWALFVVSLLSIISLWGSMSSFKLLSYNKYRSHNEKNEESDKSDGCADEEAYIGKTRSKTE